MFIERRVNDAGYVITTTVELEPCGSNHTFYPLEGRLIMDSLEKSGALWIGAATRLANDGFRLTFSGDISDEGAHKLQKRLTEGIDSLREFEYVTKLYGQLCEARKEPTT